MRGLKHTNVLRIYDFYELDAEYYYIVLELMHGGELFRRIEKKVMVLCGLCVLFVGLCNGECQPPWAGRGRAERGGAG